MSKKSIKYLEGYTVKPFQVLENGQVIFTDGQTTMPPNQQQCEHMVINIIKKKELVLYLEAIQI